jgi:eukaryotic-like serine/threonine-protein kinase
MPTSSADRNPVEQLAEEFAERYRRGERPSLTEYTERHPQWADEIRDLFPALVMVEQFKPKPSDATGDHDMAGGSNRPPLEQLGEYRILREVGRGGMGVVYEAEQQSLGRHVALKVLPTHGLLNPTFLERFRREAKAAARLHHTNIVPVFGVGECQAGDAGTPVHYYAMQFIRGEGLDKVLHDLRRLRHVRQAMGENGAPAATLAEGSIAGSLLNGQFGVGPAIPDDAPPLACRTDCPSVLQPEQTSAPTSAIESVPGSGLSTASSVADYYRSVARIGLQVADALAYAHRQGVLHRDVKPSNLLLDTQGIVWITDFGLAKTDGADELTHTGDIVGTVRFMAPERFDGRSLPQSDVYGLGVTLYELLTLRAAFDDTNKGRLIQKVLHEPPLPPRKIEPAVPRDLETIVLKCLAKEPAERYATVDGLAEDLRRFLADRPIKARRTPWRERSWRWCRRNPVVAGLLAAVAVLLVAVAGVSTFAAVRLNSALERTQDAEREARLREAEALVGQAHGTRYSRRAGQRFDALAALDKAAAIGRELGQPTEWFDRLRNEAVAAVALPDVEVVRQWQGWPRGTVGMRFDGTLERYARSDQHGNVSVRRVADDAEIVALPGAGRTAEVYLSQHGRLLGVHDLGTMRVKVWRLTDAAPVLIHEGADVTRWGVEFNPDNQRLLYIHRDSRISIVTLADGQVTRWPARGTAAAGPCFRPDGSQVMFHAQVNGEETVMVCDARTGSVVAKLPHPAPSYSFDWHPDGRMVATCCEDHRVRLWDTSTWEQSPVLDITLGDGGRCAFSPDGKHLLGNDWGGLLRVWDLHSGRQVFATPMGYMLLMARDGRLPFLQSDQVKLLRVSTGREFRTLPRRAAAGRGGYVAPGSIGPVALSPDGRLLAAITAERACALVEAESGAELAVIPLKTVQSLAFDTSGALLMHGSMGLLRWPVRRDPATGRCRVGPPQALYAPSSDGQHGSNPDGRILAIPNFNRGALLLHRDRSCAPVVLGPQQDVRCCAVSPDGRWVATATHGSGLKVWEVPSGRLVKVLNGGSSVGFSPDGKWLASTTHGCRLWAVGT